ncbi:uncharacterized protein LOC128286815 [Gossypium arboreum]|uniref:uncharacterized protein LOC128286815 n=1 Tax=Gossypium arboreum TaxID=29729 RepID=UPI0022F1C9A1|nr:uncharacterized protein LOC128286815 [Gossypium arboreum]
MDFVSGLPLSPKKKDVIWVIADRLTKSAHFIPVRIDYSLDRWPELYVSGIVRLHGVPISIISDRDPRITSRYWSKLQEALGTQLHFSTTFHPQIDEIACVHASLAISEFTKPFVLKTDASRVIQTPEQQRWLGKLVGYDFEIWYSSGKTSLTADALSIVPSASLFVISRPIISVMENIRLANSLIQSWKTCVTASNLTHNPSLAMSTKTIFFCTVVI